MDVQQATQVIETDPNSYITSDPSYLLANQGSDITPQPGNTGLWVSFDAAELPDSAAV